ncbi:predicted protein [Botrytis cinerea T4]|uniref:Uncharacterized protein n=1 Tax=Botryotinia fuckeliana (strain T4) TaxID=999810 RepID=G2YDP0_BOTF4|nr:predicted protein [Botrytis cinerea T4]
MKSIIMERREGAMADTSIPEDYICQHRYRLETERQYALLMTETEKIGILQERK